MNTDTQPKPVTRFRITRVDGSPLHKKSRWEYRGFGVIQEYNNHDTRNKTHKGFTWTVEWAFGYYSSPLHSRNLAKEVIDYRISQPGHMAESAS